MATAKKLPSGSWRCQVFAGYEIRDGKKKAVYKSFTVKDPSRHGKKECERLAAEWAIGRRAGQDDGALPRRVRCLTIRVIFRVI